MNLELGFLGTLVRDVNFHPDILRGCGRPLIQWGGAAYSLAAVSAGLPDGWGIRPVVKVGRDVEEEALALLRGLPGVASIDGVQVVPEQNNRVELRYRDRSTRDEVLLGGVPGWRSPELQPLLDAVDALYVNFVSGFELDLEAALQLRRVFRGPIYADLHSLFLGPAGPSPRDPRLLPGWRDWLACFDAVQLNETELGLLVRGGLPAGDPLGAILDHGPVLAVVTLGSAGARYAHRGGLGADPLRWRAAELSGCVQAEVAPEGGALEGDPTGCGDVWGGAFVTALLGGASCPAAASRANRFAAAKLAHPETSSLRARLAALSDAERPQSQ